MFDELLECASGHPQPIRAEVIAEEVETLLNPSDEGLVRVLLQSKGGKYRFNTLTALRSGRSPIGS